MALEIVTAILATLGVVSIAWWCSFWLTRPRRREPFFLVVRPQDADGLHNAAMQAEWMRQRGVDVRLSVAVDGLDSEGMHMAQLLERDCKYITLDA